MRPIGYIVAVLAGVPASFVAGAAVFADGRYTLQVEKEVDGGLFEHCHLTDKPPADWIAANLAPGARLGFDPWLLTPVQTARFQAACKKARGELAACDGNPVDAVWTGQPTAPLSPVVAHDAAFAGDSSNDKRRRIADGLKADKAGAVVLTAPDSIAWLLNVRGADVECAPLPHSFVILHTDGQVQWFVDPRKQVAELAEHLGNEVSSAPPEALGAALDALAAAGGSVQIDPAGAPDWAYQRLHAAGVTVIKKADPCALPKACKNEIELDGMRAAPEESRWPDGFRTSRFVPAVEYLQAQRVRMRIIEEVHEALGDFDLFIGSNLALTNLTGHPEISMPNGFFQGSPTSLRFTGKLFGEAEILLLAHAYQTATDHHLRHPSIT